MGMWCYPKVKINKIEEQMQFYKSMFVSLEFPLMLILTDLKIALVTIKFLPMIKEGIYSSIIHVPFDLFICISYFDQNYMQMR
jgi:hypothetical protein